MRLIDDLEAAAKADLSSLPVLHPRTNDRIAADHLLRSSYWPRIKAALEAGEEMADFLGERFELESVARFRAAAGEGS